MAADLDLTREADYSAYVECPHCGEVTHIDGSALSGSGIVRDQFFRCDSCKERFNTRATIDIGVYP